MECREVSKVDVGNSGLSASFWSIARVLCEVVSTGSKAFVHQLDALCSCAVTNFTGQII